MNFNDYISYADKPVSVEEVVLEKMRFCYSAMVSQDMYCFADPPKIEVRKDFRTENLLIHLQQSVLGRQLEEVSATYPADWWQAVKDRWAPSWFLRRWPVQWAHIELKATELYPKIAMPREEHFFRLAKWVNGSEVTPWSN